MCYNKCMNFIDLTGQTFGGLTVIRQITTEKRKPLKWLCKCVCGNARILTGTVLKSNTKTKVCKECCRKVVADRFRKYPKELAYTYSSWRSMLGRCVNKVPTNSRPYKDYQIRNIKVCKRWLKFENFFADMGLRPQNTSIDRINNDGNYALKNCHWATAQQQSNNRRPPSDLILVDYKGKQCSLKILAKISGFKIITLRQRINCGWSIERAVETPLANRGWGTSR